MSRITLQSAYEYLEEAEVLRLQVGTSLCINARVNKRPVHIKMDYAFTGSDAPLDEKYSFLQQGPLHALETAVLKPRNSSLLTTNFLEAPYAKKIIENHFYIGDSGTEFNFGLETMLIQIWCREKSIRFGISDESSVVKQITTYKNGKSKIKDISASAFYSTVSER